MVGVKRGDFVFQVGGKGASSGIWRWIGSAVGRVHLGDRGGGGLACSVVGDKGDRPAKMQSLLWGAGSE